MTSNVFHCKTANIQHRLFLRLHHFLCWLSHHWATEGYNSFKSWKSPWDVRCFDGAFIQSLLWFIPPVTGIQDKPESCHIWDSSLQDHAMWPWRKRMVNEPTLRCSSFLILIAFSLFFFFLPLARLVSSIPDASCVSSKPWNLFVYVGGYRSTSPLSSLLSSVLSPLWSHLLLKTAVHKPTPQTSHAPQTPSESKPQDPCPHRRTWIMHAVFQLDAGFAVTYITPIALSILCDFPPLADASAHTVWFKKIVQKHQKLTHCKMVINLTHRIS